MKTTALLTGFRASTGLPQTRFKCEFAVDRPEEIDDMQFYSVLQSMLHAVYTKVEIDFPISKSDPFCPRHGRASRPVTIEGLRCDCPTGLVKR